MKRLAIAIVVLVAGISGLRIGATSQDGQIPSFQPTPSDGLLANSETSLVPYGEAMRSLEERAAALNLPPGITLQEQPEASITAADPPKELVELARALRNDPDLIYEYVYNNIDTLPMYGSLKGPLGAMLDGRGTSFDQAELMFELLKLAKLEPSYEFGQIQLTAQELTDWLGTDTTPAGVSLVLSRGGISGSVVQSGGTLTAANLAWAWVRVPINGTSYVFNPSRKTYDRSPRLASLGSILSYDRANFLASATSGATITPTTAVGINRTALRSNLGTLTGNLIDRLRPD
jgi:hypothetical protein